ncbi:MAG TPA: hypothetical protein DCG57_15870 [Candidatus Riflebacteria bacterium]|jgi:hypothetical protein|nr:hypothetical protein [Candidatus Riflebacteria bacterium]
MELVKKISQLLTRLRDRRAAARYGDADVCAPCVINIAEFPVQAWQDFVGFVDESEKNPDSSSRNCLQRLSTINSHGDCLDFFAGLAQSSDQWRPIASFADIPVLFDNDLFDRVTSEYEKARNVSEQSAMIPELFCKADPTILELLSLMLEGDIERYPQPVAATTQELVNREMAARKQLTALLSGTWSDEVRWWLIRSIACAAAPARSFLRGQLLENRDERLACMTFPALLKAGFSLLKSRDSQEDPKSGQLQKLYSGQLTRLTGIIGNNLT